MRSTIRRARDSGSVESVSSRLSCATALSNRGSDAFLTSVEEATSFVRRPLHALLHESIYCNGSASRWAAQRVRDGLPHLSPDARPLQPTGEMIFPWMFDVDRSLRPLRDAAELLSAYDGWPALYDPVRLQANTVPVAAAIYNDDSTYMSSW